MCYVGDKGNRRCPMCWSAFVLNAGFGIGMQIGGVTEGGNGSNF